MARRPTLEVDGVPYKNVYEVHYEIFTNKDETGRPTDRAHAGYVKISRESDDTVDLARWAMNTEKTNWKSGSVTFRDHNDSEMKVLKWENGFCTKYQEHCPHVKNNPDEQMWEYLEISCQKLYIADADVDNRWEE